MSFEIFTSPPSKISDRETTLQMPTYKAFDRLVDPSKYLAMDGLKHAVNVAINLGQPLLVTGEPGTGKTQLADCIAYQLETECHKFYTKSNAESKDLFYRYDSIRRFHDAQNPTSSAKSVMNYITFEALGKAIKESHIRRSVVLVDEIDKAPRDFPNDLLNEIEQMEFTILETGQRVIGKIANRPIVIITSNSEKNLPDPFLRRCVYYHIPFPNREWLIKIVNNRLPLSENFSMGMVEAAVDHFLELRENDGLRKKPATAELLAWIHVLGKLNIDVTTNIPGEIERLKKTYTVLAKNQEDLDLLT